MAQLALASQLPLLRPAIVARIIERTARANASFAFTTGLAETVPVLSAPLNLGDIVVLTKNQVMMCYRIALASGRDGEPRALIGEILGVLGGGCCSAQAARQLVGLIPFIGILPKVAVAYAGTYAIGRATSAWLTDGRRNHLGDDREVPRVRASTAALRWPSDCRVLPRQYANRASSGCASFCPCRDVAPETALLS